jgi:hypothetical protein
MAVFGTLTLLVIVLGVFALVLLSPALVAVLASRSPVFNFHVTTRRRTRCVVASDAPILAMGVYRGFIGEPTVVTVEQEELVETVCPPAVERAAAVCRVYGVAWMVLAVPIVLGVLYEIAQPALGPFTFIGASGLALATTALSVRSDLLRMKPNATRAARLLSTFVLCHLVGLVVGMVEAARPSAGCWEILSLESLGFIAIFGIMLSAIVAGELARALGPFKEALAQADPVKPAS